MVDFHSHCLPSLDDGACDRAESIAMLQESRRQGVDTVVATPHYYASHESIDDFLSHRAAAVERLGDGAPEGLRLVLGAEVLLQEGVAARDLRSLCIEGTRCILVELPFMSPTGWMVEELEAIALGQRLDVILAHVDRYMPWYSREQMESMMDFPGLTVQLNAETVNDRRAYRQLRQWLPSAERVVFGSDMHHIDHRAPNLQPAYRRLRHSIFGRRLLALAQQTSEQLLSGSSDGMIGFLNT